jgi:hypothetical protein
MANHTKLKGAKPDAIIETTTSKRRTFPFALPFFALLLQHKTGVCEEAL